MEFKPGVIYTNKPYSECTHAERMRRLELIAYVHVRATELAKKTAEERARGFKALWEV